jgi:uncharacterized protein
MIFDWDPVKEKANVVKHGVSFHEAQFAFKDPNRIITIPISFPICVILSE